MRLGSVRFGSDETKPKYRFDSFRFGPDSDRTGSGRFGSVRTGSGRSGSVRNGPGRFGSVRTAGPNQGLGLGLDLGFGSWCWVLV